jgi:hypothetical protein
MWAGTHMVLGSVKPSKMEFHTGSRATGNAEKYIQLTTCDCSRKHKKKACGAVPFVAKQFSMDCGRRYETGFARHNPCLRNALHINFTVLSTSWVKHNRCTSPRPAPIPSFVKYAMKQNMMQWIQLWTRNQKMAWTWKKCNKQIPRHIQKYKAYLKYLRIIRRGLLQSECLRGQCHSSYTNTVQSSKM